MRILPTTDPLRWPSISIHVGEIAPGCGLSDGGAKTRLNVSTWYVVFFIAPRCYLSDGCQPSHDYGKER